MLTQEPSEVSGSAVESGRSIPSDFGTYALTLFELGRGALIPPHPLQIFRPSYGTERSRVHGQVIYVAPFKR